MSRHRTVITPASGWIAIRWAELWQYRSLLWVFTWRDIKVRYKQTLFGFAWAVAGPIASMVVFTVIFGKLANFESQTGDLPYALIVFTGLMPWSFFTGVMSQASNSLVGNAGLLTKVYFPRLLIPVSGIGSKMVDFMIAFAVFLCLMIYYGVMPTASILLAPFILLAMTALALGVGMFFAALIVKVRDFAMILSYFTTLWMWLTPVVYPASVISEQWRWLLDYNPMYGLIINFRASLLGTEMEWGSLGIALAITTVMLIFGMYFFTRVERTFADVV
ncbi:MAG: phosphate ABC transporter permease [Zetaproteobacteria bacterium CG_4_10_14_3_um_filter_54_28]|nr:MAG: phosphate ABC transporter permease [Zetaproteobacteria bacterium CG_4_10_14_3_um_filter_54_28]